MSISQQTAEQRAVALHELAELHAEFAEMGGAPEAVDTALAELETAISDPNAKPIIRDYASL